MERPGPPFTVDAVCFDLLTALFDSWTVWEAVAAEAGRADLGISWRHCALRLVTAAGDYRPYDELVAAAAAQVGLPARLAGTLLERWETLQPWPEVPAMLTRIALPMATATNPPVAAQGYPQQQPLSVTPSQGMPSLGQQPRRPSPPSPRTPPVGADPMMGQTTPTLFLIFNSQKIPIEKDQFIIGRGSKTSDLAIKDGNISRKHAAVIRRNGTFYIKDLGSTNGIDYKGMRIDNKRIDEGDVFHLCDYELRFTYRAD